ncbi:hypothetical protein [Streptomyces sp. NBC_01092]|uniref:hypothetical protein n=1 Tax=Streptomyces sp. NBC_01092 TaxID=2903748 RepID=UPI003864B7DA|nr:hypothetical protein OG254_40235 [Streptomyces sp. NBC_01092]
MGVAELDSFDRDVDLGSWGLGGIPVAVALPLLTATSWLLSVGATSVLAVYLPSGPAVGLLRLAVPVGALLAAWLVTRMVVRGRHRRFSRELKGSCQAGEARGADGITLT